MLVKKWINSSFGGANLASLFCSLEYIQIHVSSVQVLQNQGQQAHTVSMRCTMYPHAGFSTSSWWLYDSCFFEQFTRYLTEILWKVLVREFVFLSRPKHFATSFSRACWGRLFVVPWKINNPLKHYSQERYTLSASWIWCRDCCKMMLELKEFRNFVVSKSVLVSTNDQFFATTWWLFQFMPYERHIHKCEMREGKHFPIVISNKAVNIVECQNKEYEFDLSCRRFLMQKWVCVAAELLMKVVVFNPSILPVMW